jgi:crotonobetainyl-CoA hydratase
MDRQMSGPDGIDVAIDGPVLTIRLDRADKLNAVTPAMHAGLQAAFDGLDADPALRVAILTASGRAFCVGSDLKAAAERRARGEGPLVLPAGGYGGIALRFSREKPVIAAVNGDAFGGGFELALACDLIVASAKARFALPEPSFGMVAIGGGPHRLARMVGTQRAMDIVLTGRKITAEEALAMGLVSRVVAPERLDASARELADGFVGSAPLALAAAKQFVDRTLDYPSLQAALEGQEGLPAMRRWRASDEGREGATAFVERRAPAWTAQ